MTVNMNKMLRDFIAIRSVACCYDNKTTFITSMAAAFSCSSCACTNRGVGNVFPNGVSRSCLKEFISILHRIKQAKRVENKTDGIKILHTFHVPRHPNKIRLQLIKKTAFSERKKCHLLQKISAKVLLLMLTHTLVVY